MPTKIAFHECVHHGIAGPTPDHILASIRAEYCLPRATLPGLRVATTAGAPSLQLEDFPALARALGADAFRQLTGDLRRRADGGNLEYLPEFLSQHRYGRATPALVDLAWLELALALSDRAPATRSVGACCLPPELLRAHPDLTITLHPAWRLLDLAVPADDWRDELLAGMEVPPPPATRPTRLRIHPYRGASVGRRLKAVEFAFERALSHGASLRRATIAVGGDGHFDAIGHLQSLLMEGAVAGAQLHPVAEPGPAAFSPANEPDEVTS